MQKNDSLKVKVYFQAIFSISIHYFCRTNNYKSWKKKLTLPKSLISTQCASIGMFKANTCLRLLTAQSVPEKIEYWVIISPKHLAAQQGDCPYYRSNVKVRYAKGIHQNVRSLAL